MKAARSLTALALLFITSGMLLAGPEKTFEESFQMDPESRFSIETHKGNIRIRTANSNEIAIFARVYFEDDLGTEILDLVQVNARRSGNAVFVDVEYDQDAAENGGFFKRGWNSWPFVDFEIVIPDDSSLDVETHKSTIDIMAPAGPVELETHKGSGTLAGVRNDLEIETHKGDYEVEILDMRNLEVETHKGKLDIKIANANDFRLWAETHKGDFRFNGIAAKRANKDDDDDESYSYQEGNGKYQIEMETHKGNITLNFVNR